VDHAHDQASGNQPEAGSALFSVSSAWPGSPPGPVLITTGFIGYLVAGLPGAVVVAVATFRAIC
jgi:hypothetical protein